MEMKVKSYHTNQNWLQPRPGLPQPQQDRDPERPDPVDEEVFRLLSDIVRTRNLVVLTGLGTSLCVKDGEVVKAPTMQALWDAVREEYEQNHDADRGSWERILGIARQPQDSTDIEELLSRSKISESFVDGDELTVVSDFIRGAEATIRRKVDFVGDEDSLPTHGSFLRRLARRSVRRDRLKVFTTNYDLCFEHAAQNLGFAVVDGFAFSQPSVFDPMHFSYDIVRRTNDSEAPDYVENLFHLHKIHGSIDWELDQRTGRVLKSPFAEKPLLIYPRHTKYELAFVQPYLEMISRFQSYIREPDYPRI